ncbi:peptidyl-prolyl cis-trans isomerase [Desulfosarcina sp. OttesenSCG-928-A07]|nr:peptidyl-prolyl cis-trans isomerase [Desulfosarcina sp. OttesenSCG-928-A07]
MKKYLLITAIVTLISASLFLTAPVLAQTEDAKKTSPQVRISTSMGDIVVELDPAAAPKTVDNFLAYVNSGFYKDTLFHRVIPDFMIQGGGFDTSMKQKSTQPPVINEADNGLSNRTGTIAMARTSDPHSATAQFFINVKDNDFLNYTGKNSKGWGYCVFGKVVSGMDVVRKIEQVPTGFHSGMRDVPQTAVIIKNVSLILEVPGN